MRCLEKSLTLNGALSSIEHLYRMIKYTATKNGQLETITKTLTNLEKLFNVH